MNQLAAGSRIGPYRIIGDHPAGGYRAVGGGRRVHLEVAEHALDWRARAIQLLRASSIVSTFDHAGIAPIVARGVLPDDPALPTCLRLAPWVASDLADGLALSEVLARRSLGVDETVALIRDIATVLASVHRRGLAHDALRPEVIVMRTGTTAAYPPSQPVSPIQIGGWSELRAGDGSGDLHALGVLAYRALTGRFPGIHPPELIAGVPGVVGALVIRMLAIDPSERPDAETVAQDVAYLTADRSLSGPRFARRWTPVPPEAGVVPVSEPEVYERDEFAPWHDDDAN